jgi:hypothetical protein
MLQRIVANAASPRPVTISCVDGLACRQRRVNNASSRRVTPHRPPADEDCVVMPPAPAAGPGRLARHAASRMTCLIIRPVGRAANRLPRKCIPRAGARAAATRARRSVAGQARIAGAGDKPAA